MGEAKRRKELGIPPREKSIVLPSLDKTSIQKKVRATLYKYPLIPFIFYAVAFLILIFGVISIIKYYN